MRQSPNLTELSPSGAYPAVEDLVRLRYLSRQLSLFKPRLAQSDQAGNLLTRYRGRGMNFAEVRNYQPGDDVRSIDWRVTARTGKTHTKLYQEERERPIVILVDLRSPMFFGSQQAFKSVMASGVAAALGWAGLQHSDRIGALLFADQKIQTVRPRRSHHSVLSMIHGMVDLCGQLNSPTPTQSIQPISQLLEEARRVVRPGSAVFLISDCHDFDETCDQSLYLLTRHADMQVLRVTDPLEHQLPASALTVSDGRSRTYLGAGDRLSRARFEERQQQRRENTERLCRRHRLRLLDFDNSAPLVPALLSYFNGREAERSTSAVENRPA